ncbi:glycoside hydrolase family 2 [Streptomyces sp. PTM05]|uniref:Glycoside hydrolase family 2 n=1 Tax=Streptantibioticus parmotrematis TaxID=2873249 RepID=A0ABS7QWC2_9ACTN|nr:sugar-binding domain-containing protein [Streptantibioticus parmotrematis]MBY8886082.1 glycoside hydrolase family 2 [Streptantibioticus parmotrematis]
MTVFRSEYPRPHFDRSHTWLSLNGTWDFAGDPAGTTTARQPADADRTWPDHITVPFAWETEASGVGAHWLEHGWYHRTITVPAQWHGQRVVLHFGAVHHRAEVWVDGTAVGAHEGGYIPFEFDITEALGGRATASLLVRVWAPVDKREIVHGKQRSIPRDDYDDCAFTPTSGIWQPVWLEARPATHLTRVALTPDDTLDGITVAVTVAGPSATGSRLTVTTPGEPPVTAVVEDAEGTVTLRLPVREPRLWHPDDPYLYEVGVTLESADGTDRVGTSTGLRRIEADGTRLLLNGEPLYVRGVLDQGYWPRTGMTAPDDEAFVTDLALARDAGFNLVRKHLKLEDPRFLHHADRVGMLVWAEPASTGRFSAEAAARFEAQIEPMVHRDGNHPSVVIWGLYNEEWGLDWDVPGDPDKQDAVHRAYDRLTSLDRTRPVVDNSGWAHVTTDLVDWHVYDETPAGWSVKVRALLADGAKSFPVGLGPGRVVEKLVMADGGPAPEVPNLNSEFGGGKTSVERGWNMRWQTLELRRHDSLSGYVWTELYDVEHEMAGVHAFDRGRKDDGGNPPHTINAATVLVPDVEPFAPGHDLTAGPDRTVDFTVRVSHHGAAVIDAAVVPVWGPSLGDLDTDLARRAAVDAVALHTTRVEPFRLSEPISVTGRVPDGATAARLHLLVVSGGEVAGRSCVDVRIA